MVVAGGAEAGGGGGGQGQAAVGAGGCLLLASGANTQLPGLRPGRMAMVSDRIRGGAATEVAVG